MARISQEQTQERHAFLLNLFRSQPELSRQEAMDAYKEKFGATINLKTLTQLREEAQKNADADEPEADEPSHDEDSEDSEETSAEDAASRLKAAASASEPQGASAQPSPKAKPAKGARQKNVFVDAPKEHLDFLQRIIGQLQEAGATNVRIDHSTDRWMVVVVDAK